MRHRPSHLPTLCLLGLLLLMASALHAQQFRQHYRITVDDGSNNVQQYDGDTARAKYREQINSAERRQRPLPPNAHDNTGPAKKTSPASAPTENNQAPAPNRGITLPDGRQLPFALGPKIRESFGAAHSNATNSPQKTVDESVDPYSALRNYNRLDDNLASRRHNTGQWNRVSRADFTNDSLSTPDTMNDWNSRFNAWPNFQNVPIAPNDAFDLTPREKTLLEHDRSNTHATSPWADERAQHRNLDRRLPSERDNPYAAASTKPTDFSTHLQERYRRLKKLSMQDINRYQFRRAHSSKPGLPVTAPGSSSLKTSTP
ncbi:MAG: hypothetical protein LBD14_03125 [Puniceicoccales bacterium]|jgi:hypothetical protein|nr:hypothetical protein [Puniceicoccales bacterium]